MTIETSPDGSRTTTDPEEGLDSDGLSLDVVYDLLSNERRRRVLRYLFEESATTTLGDLAEQIAAVENDTSVEALSSTERKRVYICLYQCHLPKMDDAGVVDFDEDCKTVEVGENADGVTRYLSGNPHAGSSGEADGLVAAVTALTGKLPDVR